MSVSYAPVHLEVPKGFQTLLEGLTREVLRQQPDDIISFSAQYFRYRLEIRQTGTIQGPVSADRKSSTALSSLGQSSAQHLETNQSPQQDTESDGVSDHETEPPETHTEGEELPKASENPEIDLDMDDPELAGAALKIQASFRGMQKRKKINRSDAAAKPEGDAANEEAMPVKPEEGSESGDKAVAQGEEKGQDEKEGGFEEGDERAAELHTATDKAPAEIDEETAEEKGEVETEDETEGGSDEAESATERAAEGEAEEEGGNGEQEGEDDDLGIEDDDGGEDSSDEADPAKEDDAT